MRNSGAPSVRTGRNKRGNTDDIKARSDRHSESEARIESAAEELAEYIAAPVASLDPAADPAIAAIPIGPATAPQVAERLGQASAAVHKSAEITTDIAGAASLESSDIMRRTVEIAASNVRELAECRTLPELIATQMKQMQSATELWLQQVSRMGEVYLSAMRMGRK